MQLVSAHCNGRGNLRRLNLRERFRQRREIVRLEKVFDGGGPCLQMTEERVTVVTDGRREDELVLTSLRTKSGVKLFRKLGPEKLVILRVDPQHRHPRTFAEIAICVHQVLGVTYVVICDRAATTGEVDRSHKAARRSCGERDGRESSG